MNKNRFHIEEWRNGVFVRRLEQEYETRKLIPKEYDSRFNYRIVPHEFNCTNCGSKDGYYYSETSEICKMMYERDICFACGFWFEKIEEIENGKKYLVTGNTVYWASNRIPENQPGCNEWSHGHHGRKFHILMNEEEFYTDDLWCCGSIPEWAKKYFKENGKFLP